MHGPDPVERALEEQRAYYAARAAEYDEWFLRQGRYDRGPEANARWHAEVEEVRRALDGFGPRGETLEIACGTGLWTERLLRHDIRLTALDASPEMLELARHRVGDRAEWVLADVFRFNPAGTFDTVFFGFWLSHVPPERFESFWERVANWLAPGGRVFLVDSLPAPDSRARDHDAADAGAHTQRRRLNDGREYEVFKVYHTPEELTARLASLGWRSTLDRTRDFFLYGCAFF